MPKEKAVYSKICFLVSISVFLIIFSYFAEAGGGGGRRGGGSPPPPPPCPIQSAGCYKTGDVKAGFGDLSPSDFAYFLPENKCKRSGGCDCKGVLDDIPQEKNPDDSSGACNCIAGTDFNAKAKCCGDDIEDCARISSGVLCNIDANSESAQWLPSTPNLGDIRFVGCSRFEYLSDGVNWIKCDGTFWRRTVGNSEYVCIGRGRESIVECCGDGSCKSRVDGKRLSTGQSVNPATGSLNEALVKVELEVNDLSSGNLKKLTDKGFIIDSNVIKDITGKVIISVTGNIIIKGVMPESKVEEIKNLDFVESVTVTQPLPSVQTARSEPQAATSSSSQDSGGASTGSSGAGSSSGDSGSGGSGSGESPSAERERIISERKSHQTGL